MRAKKIAWSSSISLAAMMAGGVERRGWPDVVDANQSSVMWAPSGRIDMISISQSMVVGIEPSESSNVVPANQAALYSAMAEPAPLSARCFSTHALGDGPECGDGDVMDGEGACVVIKVTEGGLFAADCNASKASCFLTRSWRCDIMAD